jgi:hypothetical protein
MSLLAFTFLLPMKASRIEKENQRISSDFFFAQRKRHALFSRFRGTIKNSLHTIPLKNKKCLYIITVHSLLKMCFVKHISFIHFKLEEPLYFKKHSFLYSPVSLKWKFRFT